MPQRRPGREHVFHQYVVRTPERDALRATLQSAGSAPTSTIRCRSICSLPISGRVAIGAAGLGESERAAREVLSLPIFPELGDDQAARVVAALKELSRGG